MTHYNMVNVSELFKESIQEPSRVFRSYVYDILADTYIRDSDDLKSIKIINEGDFFRTVLRQANISLFGNHSLLGKDVQIGIGIELKPEVTLGTFTFIGLGTPATIELTDHGLLTGDRIKLFGTLPSGVIEDTYYYVVNMYTDEELNVNQFNISVTYNDSIGENPTLINVDGAGSGTLTLKSYPYIGTGDTEYVDFGTFRVVEQKENKETGVTELKLYDKMYEALKIYDSLEIEYPCTLKQYLQQICAELGWTLGTSTFHNEDLIVGSDLFVFRGYTYRRVLEQIAETTGTTIVFNYDDELELRQIPSSIDYILDNEILEMKVEEPWGAVNSIALVRKPDLPYNIVFNGGYESPLLLLQDEDELLLQDDNNITLQSIEEIEDLWQIRFENNFFMDSDRQTAVNGLGDLLGLEYYPFEVKSKGSIFLELGDYITITDRADTTYNTYINSYTLSLDESGYSETLGAKEPYKGYSRYKKSGDIIEEVVSKSEFDTPNIRDGAVTDVKVSSISADKITTGTITAQAQVGANEGLGKIVIDGELVQIYMLNDDGIKTTLWGKVDE